MRNQRKSRPGVPRPLKGSGVRLTHSFSSRLEAGSNPSSKSPRIWWFQRFCNRGDLGFISVWIVEQEIRARVGVSALRQASNVDACPLLKGWLTYTFKHPGRERKNRSCCAPSSTMSATRTFCPAGPIHASGLIVCMDHLADWIVQERLFGSLSECLSPFGTLALLPLNCE